ncbi:MAG TPA: GIY-YIG nuclease family protein [Candidatus Kryptobacter bacterium]|nr:GIY-YIG nuclease family protein [Candidatus Kryptobacter bacterium]
MRKIFCVYMMTNKYKTVLYTGVSSILPQRVRQHKDKIIDGFTKRYNVDKLVYFEICSDAYTAITREKQIKSWPRKKKEDLINDLNPEWRDLSEEVLEWGQ